MTLYVPGWCDVIGVAAESSTSIIDVAVIIRGFNPIVYVGSVDS